MPTPIPKILRGAVFAWYIIMGGFELAPPPGTEWDIGPEEEPLRWQLQYPDVIRLAEWGMLDYDLVTLENITDRSKADAVAKAIAGVQVLWMVAQSAARAYAGLSLTILEVFTPYPLAYYPGGAHAFALVEEADVCARADAGIR